MGLADYVDANRHRLIERWKQYAQSRLSLKLDESALLNDLPQLLDELIGALREPDKDWEPTEAAERHARQRMSIGIDIGSLVKEIALVGETVVELARDDGENFTGDEFRSLMRGVSEAAAASASAYAEMRNSEHASQAAMHFAFIAHEIRTPLQNARLAAQLLQSESASGEASAQLERSLEQLSDLVDDSLMEARLYGEPQLHLQPVTVREIVDAARQDAEPRARAHSLTIRMQAEDFELEADRRVLVSAVTNLLINAAKFCTEGRTVTVRARREGERAVIEVEDECGGIPEELLPRLFKPFSQSVGRQEGRKGGFGLGLMIVKQAAEVHGGSVSVRNRPTVGCCFVLDLPISQPGKHPEA